MTMTPTNLSGAEALECTIPVSGLSCRQLPVLFAQHTTAGARSVNQDVVSTLDLKIGTDRISIALVADGMGGHRGGEIASGTATRKFLYTMLEEYLEQHIPDFSVVLQVAFQAANDAVILRAKADRDLLDMGTTLAACVLLNDILYVASVGDSRVYFLHLRSLFQLTRDDSVVQELVDQGLLHPNEAESHPRANEITRALGTPGDADGLMVSTHTVLPGDVVIVCTDGLWKGGEADLCAFCSLLKGLDFTQANLDEAVSIWVEQALARGSEDNIGVAVIWVKSDPAPAIP